MKNRFYKRPITIGTCKSIAGLYYQQQQKRIHSHTHTHIHTHRDTIEKNSKAICMSGEKRTRKLQQQ